MSDICWFCDRNLGPYKEAGSMVRLTVTMTGPIGESSRHQIVCRSCFEQALIEFAREPFPWKVTR